MSAPRSSDFAMTIGYRSETAVVGLRGDLDVLTSPVLGGVLGALADQGHRQVTLDLHALQFLGASGLGVIADAAGRLRRRETELTIRAAGSSIRQILDISGVSALVSVLPGVPMLGAEERDGDRLRAIDSRPADLVTDLARIGSTVPTSERFVDAALRLVSALAKATVGGADGVSVSLERRGAMTTVASTNDTVLKMDAHQYETGEGPCLAAASEGHWFHVESLAEEERWPTFTPLAIKEGIASILSTPLLGAKRPVGALNIYSHTVGSFGPPEQELAGLFATQASAILADAGLEVSEAEVGTRVFDALLVREVIAQAQGVLMARQHVSADAAAAQLHRSARSQRVTLLRHAEEVLASTRDEDRADPGPASG